MVNLFKNLNILADFGRKKALPCLYLESNKGSGYAWDECQAAAMIENAADIRISLNPLKIDEGSRLQPGQLVKDLYGSWNDAKAPDDDEIPARLWMVFPITCYIGLSPDEQIKELTRAAEMIISECVSHGWGRPYILKDGPIWMILYKCRLIRNEEIELLYSKVWGIIAKAHQTAEAKVLNADNLCMINLGADLSCPRQSTEITADHLRGFLQDLHMEKITPEEWNCYRPEKFQMMDWLTKNNINQSMTKSDGIEIYKLGENETIYHDKLGCKVGFYDKRDPSRKWSDFRIDVASTDEDLEWKQARQQMWEDFNRNKPAKGHLRQLNENIDYSDPRKFTISGEDFLKMDRSPKQYLKTGINLLDESPDGRHHGIPRKGITLLMARTSAGKTALMTQIKAYMTLQMKYRVWEFNAELSKEDVGKYFECNAVGIDRLQQPRRGVYNVAIDDATTLWREIRDRYDLFDHNQFGFKWEYIEESIIWVCMTKGVDCVILDDQIMIDLGIFKVGPSNDGESEAVALMRRLQQIAHFYNVAIIMICHPRKEQETKLANNRLVMAEDILGSVKIPSLATMILLLHRVYEMDDFERKARNTSGIFLEENDKILASKADSVLQIAKDRFGGGSQSYLMPLYYEAGTNRFKNSRTEHRIYPIFQQTQPYSIDVNPFA